MNQATSVGVSLVPNEKPTDLVPRSEFQARSGVVTSREKVIHRRVELERLSAVLSAPALTDGTSKWKFTLGGKTFWATMDDAVFLVRIRPGSNQPLPMILGLQFDIDVETTQEFIGNVWVNVGHRITKVHDISVPSHQPSWLDSPSKDGQPN